VRARGIQSYRTFLGSHKAIFNQESIEFNGLIEPAYKIGIKYFEILHACFMTQQGQALRVIS
jgi:hypothetical protein